MKPLLQSVLLAGSALAITAPVGAQDVSGYLVDGAGNPVRSGMGGCIKSGSWSPEKPGAGCDGTPDRIVLLPGPDGKVGAVVVRSARGEQLIDKAFGGVEVSAGGGLSMRQEDPALVKTRYAGALASQPPRPVSYVVNFASGSATDLTPQSLPVIDAMKAAVKLRPAPEIAVIGHTDRVGKLEANDALSRKRAEVVRDILVQAGIQAASLEIAGRGEREPLIATADEVEEARNRRVEISVR